jgi:hypothetical protein
MAAPIRAGESAVVGVPIALFTMAPRWSDFDVDRTGRFLAIVTESRAALEPLTVVRNWTAALDR